MAEIVERNEKGQVVSSYLSPDAAREMQAMRRLKADRQADSSTAILAEMGFTDDNPAPELVKNLAEIAVSQRSGAVSAIGSLIKIAGGDSKGGAVHLKPGDVCPTCGHGYTLGLELTRELVKLISREVESP
jgi:hypothetical protein